MPTVSMHDFSSLRSPTGPAAQAPKPTMPAAFNSYKPRWLRVYGAICVNPRGEVLLVCGKRSHKWSFPKGHCKHTEADEDCARRELSEETGLDIPSTQKAVSIHKLRGGMYFVFAVEDEVALTPHDHWEIEKAAWWPLNALPRDTNIDVSIFRTLMRGQNAEASVEYLESGAARRRLTNIKQNIEAASTALDVPMDIPRSLTSV